MKWQGRRQSNNVRDQRQSGGSSGGGMSSGMIMSLITLFFRGGITKTKILIGVVVLGSPVSGGQSFGYH
ncbi:MAG: neutral zinc metallopeptidase [Saprospiraceae bacterium]|nr:neutral zinc metallopeptidase [Saprospiraceae bacterium]